MSDFKPVSIDAASFSIDTSSLQSQSALQPPAAKPAHRSWRGGAAARQARNPGGTVLVEDPAARSPDPQQPAAGCGATDLDGQFDSVLLEQPPASSGRTAAEPLSQTTDTKAVRKPVWEVDQFRWPALCDRLIDEEHEYFAHAGQKLLDASQRGLKILAVTADSEGEGSTTLSICLARAAAAAGASVAIVDADLQRRQLAMGLGLDLSHGWLDAAAGAVPWNEAAVNSLQDGLSVFPARPLTDQSVAVIPSAVPGTLKEISGNFDLVVLDIGPLTNDACHLLIRGKDCSADAAIVVRDMRKTSELTTLEVARRLKALGAQAVGIAENYSSSQTAAAAA